MGVYIIDEEEFEEPFEDFLQSQEGEVHKDTLIKCWNKLSKKFGWNEEIREVNERGTGK